MDFKVMARRARRAILIRSALKLVLVASLGFSLVGWLVYPQAPVWANAARTISTVANVARSVAIRALGGNPAVIREETQQLGSVEIGRIRATGGFPAGEVRCLSLAIYFEAGYETREAQLGVGQIVIGRAKERKAPRDLCRVVYNGMPNTCLFEATCRNLGVAPRAGPALAGAIEVAQSIAGGETAPGRLAAATHFHERGSRPVWSRDLFRLGTFGRLAFYSTEQPADAIVAPTHDEVDKSVPSRPAQQRRTARPEPARSEAIKRPTSSGFGSLGRQVFGID